MPGLVDDFDLVEISDQPDAWEEVEQAGWSSIPASSN
jgi:hypothetical protein